VLCGKKVTEKQKVLVVVAVAVLVAAAAEAYLCIHTVITV